MPLKLKQYSWVLLMHVNCSSNTTSTLEVVWVLLSCSSEYMLTAHETRLLWKHNQSYWYMLTAQKRQMPLKLKQYSWVLWMHVYCSSNTTITLEVVWVLLSYSSEYMLPAAEPRLLWKHNQSYWYMLTALKNDKCLWNWSSTLGYCGCMLTANQTRQVLLKWYEYFWVVALNIRWLLLKHDCYGNIISHIDICWLLKNDKCLWNRSSTLQYCWCMLTAHQGRQLHLKWYEYFWVIALNICWLLLSHDCYGNIISHIDICWLLSKTTNAFEIEAVLLSTVDACLLLIKHDKYTRTGMSTFEL
jgi:hypothetical protein